nr:MAG TPA: NAD-DEPENDENT PROTEIN DEACETYLASE SIRTUIN-3, MITOCHONDRIAL, LYSINE DEACETYLASE, ADP RIBOSE [Caudoviricetes sp.]
MDEYISRKAAIAYIREQSEEWQKAFEELGGESGIYADTYNDLAEDFYSIPAADVAPVVHGRWVDGKCSNCGVDIPTDDTHDAIFENECRFCYYCGALMDGGDSNATY